jgi:hypothetical protein
MQKQYRLLGAEGRLYFSAIPGQLGGNSTLKIYGSLACSSANRAIPQGYADIRVFFADEQTAIAAGYRPCGNCMRTRYKEWQVGGTPGSELYPWLVTPKVFQQKSNP